MYQLQTLILKRMIQKKLLLLIRHFTLELQELNNGNFINFTRFTLKTNSKQLVRCMNTKVLDKNSLLEYIERINVGHKYNIPLRYISVNKNTKDLYIINEIVAEQFVSLIQTDIQENASHIVELNPGLGLITQQLLKIGIPFVHMYERETQFIDTLNKLYNEFPHRLSVQEANLYNLAKLMNINATNNKIHATYDLLKNVKQKQWNEESCMQIIGATNRVSFLRHLILSTVFRTCFMMYGRPIFYLAISPSIWNKFTGTAIRSNSVMFQTIFDYHIFGKVDRKAFIPWTKGQFKKKHIHIFPSKKWKESNCSEDVSYLYVVKIEPKREIPITHYGKNDLLYFWYFIRHNLYRPTMRVIPSMEKLVPGCGVRLIALDLNVFTQYSDLSIKQIQDLYLEFRSWPEFEESIFTSNVAFINSIYNNYVVQEAENEYNSTTNSETEKQ